MLDNYQRYWSVKSSRLGDLLDQEAVVRAQKRFQLNRMHGAVHETTKHVSLLQQQAASMQSNGATDFDTAREENRLLAHGVITWKQSTQRFVASCETLCDLSYVIRMRNQLLQGDYSLPNTWRYFPMPPDPSSNNALRQVRDVLAVARLDCSKSCTGDVTLARQSHEPSGYIGAHKEIVHEFFAVLKSGCLICSGLVKTLLQSAVLGNGRGNTDSRSYCKDSLWSAWSDNYFASQVFDVTQPFAFDRANTQKEGPREFNYANRFCLGLSDELLLPIRGWLQSNGLSQLHEHPTLYEALQLMTMSSDLSIDGLSDKICSDYVGCPKDGISPIARQISANLRKTKTLTSTIADEVANVETLGKQLEKDHQDAAKKKTIVAEKKVMEANVAAENKKLSNLKKTLIALQKEESTAVAVDKKKEAQCLFQCYKPTAWDKQFRLRREDHGLMDPIPASQLAAMHAGDPCGYPVVLKKPETDTPTGVDSLAPRAKSGGGGKGQECSHCTALPCLIKARLKCFEEGCKSPYVSTSGVAFYVPKTVVM